jgi:hypothetical protein
MKTIRCTEADRKGRLKVAARSADHVVEAAISI